jgi:hypothetical protein
VNPGSTTKAPRNSTSLEKDEGTANLLVKIPLAAIKVGRPLL